MYFAVASDFGSNVFLARVHRCGGPVMMLTGIVEYPSALLVDGDYLYWSAMNVVARTTK